MDYKVKVRYIRIGRRKISRLFTFVKGLYVQRGIANLRTMPQESSKVLSNAIKSGIANALFATRTINPDTLWVKEVQCTDGPRLKRIKAGSRGSAERIIKPYCHLTVVLSDEPMPEKKKRIKKGGPKKIDTRSSAVENETVVVSEIKESTDSSNKE